MNKLLKMTFYCLFYQFIVGKFSGPMAMLDNFMGHVGQWTILWAMLDDLGSLDQWILPLGGCDFFI